MKSDKELLIRYLEGSLDSAETEGREQRLSTEDELADQLRSLQAMHKRLTDARSDQFGPFFVDRTMKAIHGLSPSSVPSLYDALQWVFVRAAVAAVALVVILGTLNALHYHDLDLASTWFEAAFGLPSTTVEDAFSLGLM